MNSTQSIFNYFLEQKNKSPNKTAIYYSNIAITYQELFDKVIYYSDLTRSLCSNRVPVALHMDRTPDLIAAMFACCYLDRPYIPFDINHPLERKLSILNNLGLNVLEIPDILPLSENVAFPNTAYILFTSGSTGQPKGIEINVRGVTNLIEWAGDYYAPEQLQCVLASTTICFDLSIFEIFVPLCLGYSIYLVDNILDLLNEKPQYSKITLINSVPSAMREIVEADCIPSNVNTINLAGEALYWSLVDKLYLKSSIKSVYNLWGPSEDTTFSSIYKCPKYHDGKQPSVPIGKSIKGSKIKLVDSEIWLSGPCLANGYYKREDLNKTKFVIKNSIRYFRTGDIAELDKDGNLVFKGRIDFQVKIRGFRIELEELENHVLNMEHTIDVGVTTIDEGQNIKLVIVLFFNNSGSIEDIKKQLSKRVTGYMMPHYWLTVDSPLPRTPNGKLCRQTLKKLVSQNYLLPNKQFDVDSFCSLVSTVLNVPVDPNLGLISQGGDSLDAVRIFSECNKRWNNNITLEKLLSQNYTIADLEKLADVTRVKTLEESLTLFKNNEVSFEEARMYNVYIHSKDSSSYNIAIKFNILSKKLDIDKLRKSCHYILSNNKIFQCNYVLKNGEIYKQYNPKDVIISDILDPSFQDLPFDLSTDLLVRVILTHQISDCYCLYFCFPHVVIDGIGIDNLMNQISKHYAGNDVNVDHVIISNSRNCISQALEFWEKELAQYEPLVSWPNNNYLSSNSYRNAIEIDTETKKILCDYAYKLDLSLPTLLFGAFYITLYRMDFGKFLTIGCPTANRCSPARQQLVANCINTLPILAEIRGDNTVKQFFSYFRKKFLQCLSFQNVPTDKVLLAIANKGQHKNFDNIFDIIFSYLDIGKTFEIEGLSIESEIMFPKASKAPLVLSVVDKNDKLEFIFECQGCRISQKYLKALGEIFKHLLLELPISETKKIDSINMLPKRHLQIIRSNAIYNKIDCKEDLVQSFLRITGTYPRKIAIIDQDHSITYEELLIEAKKVKNAILSKNIPPESAIGVSMPKTWRVVSSILGILLSGCYYVPLDPRNPPSRNQYIRSKSGITLVITEDLYQEFSDIDVSDKDFHQNREFLDKIAYVIFTSGTTGTPKGVATTHRNVARLFLACQEWAHFSDKDTWTLFHSYAFDFSVWEIFGAILYGGTLVVVRDETCKDFKKFLKLITDNKISILSQTPTAFKNLLSVSDTQFDTFTPRIIVFGGESLTPNIINVWWRRYGKDKTKFINMYGITETTVHSAYKFIDEKVHNSNIGIPLQDVGIIVVDRNQELLPVGVSGEIWISGQGICKEYINDPNFNNEKFIFKNFPELCSESYRFYKTGDLAILNEDGDFEYLGRIDTQIKINGYRVEVKEITKSISKFPNIVDSHVIVVELENSIKALAAYYIASEKINHLELKSFLNQKLPNYAIPEFFIPIDFFPLTVNGKVDNIKLPKITMKPYNNRSDTIARSFEELIRASWYQTLNIRDLNSNDNFFDLGGNSIKAVVLAKNLNSNIKGKKTVSVVDVFRFPIFKQQVDNLARSILEGKEC